MFYVYLLRDKDKHFYVGYTRDLKRRMAEHLSGKTITTSKMNNPRLYYYEAYEDEKSARRREVKLKDYGSSYQGLIKRLK